MPRRYQSATITPEDFSPTDRAYLAALLDGEGNLYRRQRAGGWQCRIYNTSLLLMQWLERFGCRIKVRDNGYFSPEYPRKVAYVWTVDRQLDILIFLVCIEPYLVIKRDLARQAIREISGRHLQWRRPGVYTAYVAVGGARRQA